MQNNHYHQQSSTASNSHNEYVLQNLQTAESCTCTCVKAHTHNKQNSCHSFLRIRMNDIKLNRLLLLHLVFCLIRLFLEYLGQAGFLKEEPLTWFFTGQMFVTFTKCLSICHLPINQSPASQHRVCLFVCLGFNGTFSTNRLHRTTEIGKYIT